MRARTVVPGKPLQDRKGGAAITAGRLVTRTDRSPAIAGRNAGIRDPSACERCGAVYRRKGWRSAAASHEMLRRAAWSVCPACQQVEQGEYFGRVVLRRLDAAREPEVRRRIARVEDRARRQQPERRLVAIERGPDGIEVLTTSQKLAHRIAHELRKSFGGRVRYAWSDDEGSLFATWECPGRVTRS